MWPFKSKYAKGGVVRIPGTPPPVVYAKQFPEAPICKSKHHNNYVVLLIQEPWSGKWYMKRWYYEYDVTLTKRCEERAIRQFKHELEDYFFDHKKEFGRT